MDFALTPELKAVQQLAREITRAEVAPRAADTDDRAIFPWDVYRAMADAGLLGIGIPTEYGGTGLGTLGLALAIEQVGMHCATAASLLFMTMLPLAPILLAGSEKQKAKYAAGTAEGELRGALAMTEPDAGSDVANFQTNAYFTGADYVINGTKAFISGAEDADYFTVLVRTDAEAGHRGLTVFAIDADTPGLIVGKPEVKLGIRGLSVYEVLFENCSVPFTARIGDDSGGFHLMMKALNYVRPLVAARGLGLAEGALMHWLAFARKRQTFGKPLTDHQGLLWMAADIAAEIEAVRTLTYSCAARVDAGEYGLAQAPLMAAAKLRATELAVRAANDCLQMCGAAGYMESSPLARFLRDAKQLTIVDGTSQIQKNIIGAALLDGRLAY